MVMLRKIRSSLMGLFEQDTVLCDDRITDNIRNAMLMTAELHDIDISLEHKITYAHDIEALWYLRTDLMRGIAHCCGETVATEALTKITKLFVGHIPAAK